MASTYSWRVWVTIAVLAHLIVTLLCERLLCGYCLHQCSVLSIFGLFYHYIIISPDHVAHLPAGEARGLFRVTAVLLLITEAFGVVVAAMAHRTSVNN